MYDILWGDNYLMPFATFLFFLKIKVIENKSRHCSNYLRSLKFQSLNETFNIFFNFYRAVLFSSLLIKTDFTGIMNKSDDVSKQLNQLIGQFLLWIVARCY